MAIVADDAELAAAAAGGDTAALRELFERHMGATVNICRRITGDRLDGEDAAQEALIAAYRHIGQFRGDARFSTWLYTIATRTALRVATRRRVQQVPLDDCHAERMGTRPIAAPEDQVASRLDLDAALSSLHPEFRAAIVLRETYGLSYREIGDVLRIPEVTARTRTNRGYKALAALLSEVPEGAF
jgi:RNA polymerase sigma-70 factor (ECF subfamily)